MDWASTMKDRVKETRHKCNMTQEQFAEELGLADKNHLAKIEIGQRNPSLNLLVKIAEIGNVSLDYLVLGIKRE